MFEFNKRDSLFQMVNEAGTMLVMDPTLFPLIGNKVRYEKEQGR